MCTTLPKIAIQLLPEFEPGSQQPGFYRRNRNAEHFRGFFGRKLFDVAQDKNDSEIRIELVDDVRQDFVHLRLRKPLFRAWPPILKLAGYEVFLALNWLVKGKLVRAAFAEAHQRFVRGNAHEPG